MLVSRIRYSYYPCIVDANRFVIDVFCIGLLCRTYLIMALYINVSVIAGKTI